MYLYSISIVIKVYNLQMLTGVQGNRDNVSPVTKRNLISVALNSNSTQHSILIICEKQNQKLFQKKELPTVISFQRRDHNFKFAPSSLLKYSCHHATACKESTYRSDVRFTNVSKQLTATRITL